MCRAQETDSPGRITRANNAILLQLLQRKMEEADGLITQYMRAFAILVAAHGGLLKWVRLF